MEPQKTLLWKLNETAAKKEGVRQTIYEISRKKKNKNDDIVELESQDARWEIGKTYTGEWSNDLRDGYGVQNWSNLSRYEGEWKCNKRNGYGVHWIPIPNNFENHENVNTTKRQNHNINNKTPIELSLYKSSNVNHLLSIRNELYNNSTNPTKSASDYKLHKQYEGEWKNDFKHGKGTFYYKNGDKFEGMFNANLKCGHGIMYYSNGDKYEGDWKFNKKNGHGIYHNKQKKNVYSGYWMNNKKEGPGYCKFVNDNKLYVAEWVNDIATCGYFVNDTELKDTINNENINIQKDLIPKLKLINTDSIISQQIKTIREKRKLVRQLTNIDNINVLFEDNNELKNKIIDIFDQISIHMNNNRATNECNKQCYVNKDNLHDSISDFELPQNNTEKLSMSITQYCYDLGLQKSDKSGHNNVILIVTLLDFAKIVYLLLHN